MSVYYESDAIECQSIMKIVHFLKYFQRVVFKVYSTGEIKLEKTFSVDLHKIIKHIITRLKPIYFKRESKVLPKIAQPANII